MRKQVTFLFAMLSLVSCGAYFEDAAPLMGYHQENTAPVGYWTNETFHLTITDGPDHADKICIADDEGVIHADLHSIPANDFSLIVLSNIILAERFINEEPSTPSSLNGSLIFAAEHDGDTLYTQDAFEYIEEDDTLPFASYCLPRDPDRTLMSISYVPFCLSPTVTPDDIAVWVSARGDSEISAYRRTATASLHCP